MMALSYLSADPQRCRWKLANIIVLVQLFKVCHSLIRVMKSMAVMVSLPVSLKILAILMCSCFSTSLVLLMIIWARSTAWFWSTGTTAGDCCWCLWLQMDLAVGCHCYHCSVDQPWHYFRCGCVCMCWKSGSDVSWTMFVKAWFYIILCLTVQTISVGGWIQP